MFAFTFVLASAIAYTGAVSDLNDWKTPCTSGACGYIWDGDGDKQAFSSMMLAGPNQVLSDITPAAGWQIMGCDPKWSKGSQDIRMVCAGTPEQMAECQHLFDNGGAEETVVRLPQNCGTGPFARVQKTFVPQDQSVPDNIAKVARRAIPADGGSSQPQVHGLTLDYDFSKVPTSRGKLLFGVASSNVGTRPLTRRDLMALQKRGRARYLAQRGFFDDIGSAVTGAFEGVKSAAEGVIEDATSVAGDVVDKVTSVAEVGFDKATSAIASVATAAATAVVKGVQAVEDATTINKTDSSADIPINFDNSFTLLDANIGCQKGKLSGSADLHIDVETKVNADVKFGYTFVGSIIPLKLDDAKVFSSLSGDASATFNIDATAQGKFDTGSVPLFKAGLPALSVPGIITLGPEFSLNGELTMELDIEAQMSVTADFDFPNIDLVFPQKDGQSSAKANPKKNGNPLKLSTQASIDAKGTVTAHIIPRIDFGIDIGEGIAKATVFLDMDLAGVLEMEVQASTGGSTTIGGGADAAGASNATDTTEAAAKNSTATDKDAKATSAKAADVAKSTAKAGSKGGAKASRRAAGSAGGCVTLTGKMSIEAGLEGKIEPLFDDQKTFPIFSTQAELFKKCFGDGLPSAPAARSISGGSTMARRYKGPRIMRPRAAKASGGTKNEITPEQSKSSTSTLSCSKSVVPLGGLTSLI